MPVEKEVSQSNASHFRDRVATVDEQGKRVWVYPRKPSGPFHRARSLVAWVLVTLLVAGPWIRIAGEPLILLDIINRRFILFGFIFWPQDFHLFVLATLITIVIILLFTTIYGRIFCGWICPQTIFMEMIFRKVEYFIEGDAKDQRALNSGPWNAGKIAKKSLKHTIFYALSFFLSNILLAYIIGSEALHGIVTQPPSAHLAGFSSMIIFSGVFYFVFAWFREQVCTMVCPYGRFQAVLLDEDSIVVAYDFVRGELRGKSKPGPASGGLGDCIDCHLCVQVCPTGIDIRNGTQLECVNCTACIDACNTIMNRIKRPSGLIRYTSLSKIKDTAHRLASARVVGYSIILMVLAGALVALLVLRRDIETTILRAPGTLYQADLDSMVTNLYTFKVVNKTFDAKPITLRLLEPAGHLTVIGDSLRVGGGELIEGALLIHLHRRDLLPLTTPAMIGVYSHGELLEQVQTKFSGPTM